MPRVSGYPVSLRTAVVKGRPVVPANIPPVLSGPRQLYLGFG